MRNFSGPGGGATLGEGGKPLMFRKLLIAFGILCLLSGAEAKADDTVYAYCPLGEGYVFLYDSADGFQVLANLKCNEKLQVVDASDKTRTKVRTANGREGWVPKTSLNMPVTPKPSQAAAPVNPMPQPPQTQAAPQPPLQPQRQPARQPQAKSATQQANAAQPPAQPEVQPQQAQAIQPQIPAPPLAVSQPESAAQAQNQPESEPLSQVGALPLSQPGAPPLSQPEPQAPPQPDVKLEAAAQPQPEAMPQPEPQPQPEAQPHPEAQPQPDAQPPLKAQAQFQQPSPAATAFTPFSRLGYENVPRLEVYGGYSFMNAGTSGLSARQNLSGVDASVDVHINRWIAGELDGGAYFKTLNIVGVGTFPYHSFMGMAGPRINIRKMFFHALGGIDHLAGSGNFYSVGTTALSNNALAGGGGGGVQWNVTRKLALRTSADYVLTRFGGVTQNNIRVNLGIVFQTGTVRAE